ARYWDERYRSQETEPDRGPAEFLVEHVGLLPPGGKVLDVPMGTGRNTLYLASLGYQVTGIDISTVAIERCRREAERRGLQIEAICADLGSYPLSREAYDIALNFYYLQRDLCPRLVETLRPGGVLVFETFTIEQRQFGWGPQPDEFLLKPGELRGLFPQLEELVYREGIEEEKERGLKAIASLVARKAG
ncbi:MAG: methyltransferase domain-containing protein, partial [Dehalococcoidia bacterium]|nr:methyltransferase domain-containing protein [Dehalococcoidia bacterium]